MRIWYFITYEIPRYLICSWFGHSWNDGSVVWFKDQLNPTRYRRCKICRLIDEGQIEEVNIWRKEIRQREFL